MNTERLGAVALKIAAGVRELIAGRMAVWTWVTFALLALIAWVSADLLGPILKVLAKMTLGASLGYQIDRTAFPYARPHEPLGWAARAIVDPGTEHHGRMHYDTAARYMLRRAIIIAACIVGSTMGL